MRKKARERLDEMVMPALVQLQKIIENKRTSDQDKLKAIAMVLDRTRETAKISVSEADVTISHDVTVTTAEYRAVVGDVTSQLAKVAERARAEIESGDILDAEILDNDPA